MDSRSLDYLLGVFTLYEIDVGELSLVSFVLRSADLGSSYPHSVLEATTTIHLYPAVVLSYPSAHPAVVSYDYPAGDVLSTDSSVLS